VVDGEIQSLEDFSVIKEAEFEGENIENEDSKIEIPIVSELCPPEIHDLAADLSDLSVRIGRAFAYENYIKMQVRMCLIETENEFI
jgi:hypothetical protein